MMVGWWTKRIIKLKTLSSSHWVHCTLSCSLSRALSLSRSVSASFSFLPFRFQFNLHFVFCSIIIIFVYLWNTQNYNNTTRNVRVCVCNTRDVCVYDIWLSFILCQRNNWFDPFYSVALFYFLSFLIFVFLFVCWAGQMKNTHTWATIDWPISYG